MCVVVVVGCWCRLGYLGVCFICGLVGCCVWFFLVVCCW